jgi:hypothetical protein
MLVESGTLLQILTTISPFGVFAGFIAGALFTSAFTTAIAIVTLGELSLIYPLPVIALCGAVGAVIGDLIIFQFVKKHVTKNIQPKVCHIKDRSLWCKFKEFSKIRSFRWLTLIIAGIVVASPLPDEVGMGIFSFAKVNRKWIVIISFVFNFIGIWLIGMAAQAIAAGVM